MSIHRMVQTVKQDKEVSLEYMKILERERMIREEGREEGRRDGYASGKAELIRIIRKKERLPDSEIIIISPSGSFFISKKRYRRLL